MQQCALKVILKKARSTKKQKGRRLTLFFRALCTYKFGSNLKNSILFLEAQDGLGDEEYIHKRVVTGDVNHCEKN